MTSTPFAPLLAFIVFILLSVHSKAVAIAIPAKPFPTAAEFVKLTPKEFSEITGKKLSLTERIYFKIIRRKIKKQVLRGEFVDMATYYDKNTKTFKPDLLWLIIGTLIGPLAILFAFTSKQTKNSIKSALIGLGIFVIWFGYLFLF